MPLEYARGRPRVPGPRLSLRKLSDIELKMILRDCVDSRTISVAYCFCRQGCRMLYPIMLMGIGFLTASIVMAMLAPLIHERAVRLTVRRLASKRPKSAIDRRAHEDQLRAQFAVSILRLETAVEDAQAKAAGQLCDVAKKSAEIHF